MKRGLLVAAAPAPLTQVVREAAPLAALPFAAVASFSFLAGVGDWKKTKPAHDFFFLNWNEEHSVQLFDSTHVKLINHFTYNIQASYDTFG